MILVISDLWPPFPGGAERHIFNLSRDLMRRGEKVHVITDYALAKQFDGPPLEIQSVGVFANREAGAALIRSAIERWRPDVILTHHLFAGQFAPELEACGIPVVQLIYNGRRLPFAALGVYISRWTAEQLGDERPNDMVITPPAFDDVIAPSHGNAIGFIKPIPHKGVDLVYEVAHLMPDRQFVILRGEWQDIEIIRELPNVEFMEPVNDIRDFYARVRMVLVPSTSEDAGTIAQECALNDIVCVSSDVGGLQETNAGGMRIESRNPSAWARVISELDDVPTYDAVTERQRLAFSMTTQSRRLERFHAKIRELMA